MYKKMPVEKIPYIELKRKKEKKGKKRNNIR
jgi:hypothetical protein